MLEKILVVFYAFSPADVRKLLRQITSEKELFKNKVTGRVRSLSFLFCIILELMASLTPALLGYS